VLFKWLQTAISMRGADTVDVKFILRMRTVRGPKRHRASPRQPPRREPPDRPRHGRPWCARLAALHLLRVVETGEDMEKDLVTSCRPI